MREPRGALERPSPSAPDTPSVPPPLRSVAEKTCFAYMAESIAAAPTAAPIPSPAEIDRAVAFTREPFVYEDPKDPSKRIGFEVDIMEALARRLGVKATFVQNQWSNLVPGGRPSRWRRAATFIPSEPSFIVGPAGIWNCGRSPHRWR